MGLYNDINKMNKDFFTEAKRPFKEVKRTINKLNEINPFTAGNKSKSKNINTLNNSELQNNQTILDSNNIYDDNDYYNNEYEQQLAESNKYLQEQKDNVVNIHQLVLDANTVDPSVRKRVETEYSAEVKKILLEDNIVEKTARLHGLSQGNIIYMSDGDSGDYIDENGFKKGFRISATNGNHFDSVDSKEYRDASTYKTLKQPNAVASIVGKPVNELTEDDYQNVYNYQALQTTRALGKDYIPEPYDKNKIYEHTAYKQEPRPFLYKNVGTDRYGRDLLEIVNPYTQKNISDQLTNSPELNTSFSVYDSLNTKRNRDRALEDYKKQNSDILNEISIMNLPDEGRISQDLKIIASSGYKTLARLLQYDPTGFTDNYYWTRVADEQIGQKYADYWSGVSPKTRLKFEKGMQEFSDEWDKGNYASSLISFTKQLDRVFAESVPQMALLVAGSYATGGALGALGVEAGAFNTGFRLIGKHVLGSTLAGLDKTLQNMEIYKANNNGQEMSADQIAKTYVLGTLSLVPESFLMALNIPKLLPKQFSEGIAKLPAFDKVKETIIGGGIQNAIETATDRYVTQNQNKQKGFLEELFSNEGAKDLVTGALMSGALSGGLNGAGSVISLPFKGINKLKNNNIEKTGDILNINFKIDEEKTKNYKDNVNILGEQINERIDDTIIKDVKSNIDINEVSENILEAKKVIDFMNSMLSTAELSENQFNELNREKIDVINSIIKTKKENNKNISKKEIANFLENVLDLTAEEIFHEQVFYSDINPNMRLLNNSLNTEENINNIKNNLYDTADLLGISKDKATKLIESISYDTADGWRGYNTYANQISSISLTLKNKKLSDIARNKLEQNKYELINRLINLYDNQFSKLSQFAEHAGIIASGVTNSSKFEYKSGKGSFTLNGKQLANNALDSNVGAYGVFNAITSDLKNMQDIIFSQFTKEMRKELLEQFNFDLNKKIKEVKKNTRDFNDFTTLIKNRVKEESKNIELDDSTIINKISEISKSKKDDSKTTKNILELRNLSEDKLNEIKEKINNKNINYKEKENLNNTIERIIKLDKVAKEELISIKKREEEEFNIAKDFNDNLDYKLLEKTNDIEDIEKIQNEIKKHAELISSNKLKSTKALLDHFRKTWSKLEAKKKGIIEIENKTYNDLKNKTIEENPKILKAKEFISLNNFETLKKIKEKEDIVNKISEINTIINSIEDIKSKESNALLDYLNRNKNNLNKKLEKIELKEKEEEYIKTYAKIKEAKEFKDSFDYNRLEEITDINEIKNLQKDIKKTANIISDINHKEVKPLLNHFRELWSKLENKKIDELEKNEKIYSDPKEYQVSHILDKNINNSVTFKPKNWKQEVDLSKEFKVSKYPESILAIKGITEKYKKYSENVLKRMKNILFSLDNVTDKNGNEIRNKLAFFTKSSNEHESLWNSAPQLRLLYNIVPDGIDVKFIPNELAMTTVDLSLKEFLSKEFKNMMNQSPETFYGIEEESLNISDYTKLKKIINQYGIPESYIVNRLGSIILKNLGLSKNNNGTLHMYERTITGLGLYALQYGQHLGYIEKNIVDKSNFRLFKYDIPYIKLNDKSFNTIKNEYYGTDKNKGLISLKLNDKEIKEPTLEPPKLPKVIHPRNTDGIMNVGNYVHNTIKKLSKESHIILKEESEFIIKNKDKVMKRLGFLSKEEIDKLPYDARVSQESININIEMQLNHLIDGYEKFKDNKFYFNYFVSKNGRIFIDSNTLNQQNSKELHRFLVLPSTVETSFDIKNKDHIDGMYYAIAQAFKFLDEESNVKKISKAIIKEDIDKMLKDFIDINEKQFLKKYDHTGIKGIENFSHVINVLFHIKKMKEANGKKFNTFLAIENDSTASGSFIKMLQFPTKELIKKFGASVGLNTKRPSPMHIMKLKEGFNDIYQLMAKKISSKLPKSGKLGLHLFNHLSSNYSKNERIKYVWLYKMINNALPKIGEDGIVTSELRTLLKTPVMVFGHGAGKKATSAKVKREIIKDFINIYIERIDSLGLDNYLKNQPEKNHTKIKAISELFDQINKDTKSKNLYNELMTKTLSDIKIIIGNKEIDLETHFNNLLEPYANVISEELNNEFSHFKKYNASMIDIFNSMFKIFNSKYELEFNKLKKRYNESIPISEYNEMLIKLTPFYPSVRLAYTDKIHEGMLVMSTKKSKDFSNVAISPEIKNNKIEYNIGNPDIYKFTEGESSGAVYPIHFLDGMSMATLLNEFDGIIPVHDATIFSAFKNKEVTKGYNTNSGLLNHVDTYNLYNEIYERLLAICDMAKKDIDLGKDPYDIVVNEWKDKRGEIQVKYIKDIINRANELNEDNLNNKKDLYLNKNLYINNMDGIKGSVGVIQKGEGINTLSFRKELSKNKNTEKMYSNPETYLTDNILETVLQDATSNSDARVKVFDMLQNISKDLNNKIENVEHLNYLKNIVKNMDTESLKDIIVSYSTEQNYNIGVLSGNELKIGFDNKKTIDNTTRLSPFSNKSPAEIYAHELVHAIVRTWINSHSIFGISKEINELLDLQKKAMEVITYKDFMPDKYDKKLESIYVDNAKKMWDYVFNNNNTNNLQGLHEFIAHGLTNEKIMKQLSNAEVIINKKEDRFTNKIKFLDKLVSIVKNILDSIFTKKGFNKLIKRIENKNIKPSYKINLYNELNLMFENINKANEKARKTIDNSKIKNIEKLFNLFGTIRLKGNAFLTPRIKYLLNIADKYAPIENIKVPVSGSFFESAKLFSNLFLLYPFSSKRREVLPYILNQAFNLSYQGTVQTILRDSTGNDEQTSRLNIISSLTKNVEQTAKGLESTVISELNHAFSDKELNNEESSSLYNVALRTDLSSIFSKEKKDLNEIKKVLTNDSYVQSKIDKINKELEKTGHGLWYKNQAFYLAEYMVHGVGNKALNLSVENIANGFLKNERIDASKEVIENINKLVTYYAILKTDKKSKEIFSSMNDKGITTFLLMHKEITKRYSENNEIKTAKGYVKPLVDTSIDILIGTKAEEAEFNKKGYTISSNLNTSSTINKDSLFLYKRDYSIPKRRDGATFIVTGARNIGLTFKESAYDNLFNNKTMDYTDKEDVKSIVFNRLYNETSNLIKEMETKDLTKKNIAKDNYLPILDRTNTNIIDYRISIPHFISENELGLDMNGINTLSKMYSQQYMQINASTRNNILIDFLKKDMENKNSILHTNTKGIKYINLSKENNNKFLEKAKNFFPKELYSEIKKGDFYVREDWLQDLFGTPTTSLAKNKIIKQNTNNKVKKAIIVGEYILKALAYNAKQTIIFKIPKVLISNVLSNFNMSLSNESNPMKVFRYTINNTKNIREYIDNKKEYNRLLLQKDIGTISENDFKKINWYKTKLEQSPVHPLMEKGMYQAIVEDIKKDDLESIGKINKAIKGNIISKKVPNLVKSFAKQLYLSEGTPIYNFMYQAVQYSDFVARATEYQLRMEKAPNKYNIILKEGKKIKEINKEYIKYEESLTNELWDMFINYDRPQSTVEQYLNDMGLVMFTKFAKRIQHVIANNLIKNPMGVLFSLLEQSSVGSNETIYSANLFNKNWSNIFYSPLDNAENALIPIPIQYLSNNTKLF